MRRNMLVLLATLLLSVTVDTAYNRLDHITTVNELLNTCVRSNYHKEKSSEEKDLKALCKPWRKRACCTAEVAEQLHGAKPLYNFDYNHCGRPISKSCREQFLRELCFHECTPNAGPWLVKVSGYKTRRERMFDMPLCQSTCDVWWNACANDLTCVRTWNSEFEWSEKGNKCPSHKNCKQFNVIYNNSTDFCQTIWGNSWRVVPDEPGRCFQLKFSDDFNPNDEVAKYWGGLLGTASKLSVFHYSLPILLALSCFFTSHFEIS